MNPKEVSYSHPQLPLCDTPNLVPTRPVAVQLFPHAQPGCFRKGVQNYCFSATRQAAAQKKPIVFLGFGRRVFYIKL